MPSLKAIRKRIASVHSTQKITRAMKMVSAAKLRRAQEAALAARPYSRKLAELVARVVSSSAEDAHPLLRAADSPAPTSAFRNSIRDTRSSARKSSCS